MIHSCEKCFRGAEEPFLCPREGCPGAARAAMSVEDVGPRLINPTESESYCERCGWRGKTIAFHVALGCPNCGRDKVENILR